MPWFRRSSDADRIREKDGELAELLAQLGALDADAAQRVQTATTQLGLGLSSESAAVVATLIGTARSAGLDKERARAQRAGQAAMRGSAAGDRFPGALYAAGVLSESFAIRTYLDPETWAYVTAPWRNVVALPQHGESGVGAQDARARNTRALLEKELGIQSRTSTPAHAAWLARFMDSANDEQLLAAIAEGGLADDQARELLRLVRAAVRSRACSGTVVAEIVPRKLVDLAQMCREHPQEAWSSAIDDFLNASERAADVLDRLMNGPYENARARLWAYLSPRPLAPPDTPEVQFVRDEVLPGVQSQLVLHSGDNRWRAVTGFMLDSWGVSAEQAWADATSNIASAPVQEQPWPDPESPVRLISVPDMEGEWLGLVAHRRPDAPPTGYVVAMPWRGAALILRTDRLQDGRAIPAFASLAGNAFSEASKFSDELCRHLLWLQPDGTPTILCDLMEPPGSPADLPPAFVSTIARMFQQGGAA